jgi:hypothetical protein
MRCAINESRTVYALQSKVRHETIFEFMPVHRLAVCARRGGHDPLSARHALDCDALHTQAGASNPCNSP